MYAIKHARVEPLAIACQNTFFLRRGENLGRQCAVVSVTGKEKKAKSRLEDEDDRPSTTTPGIIAMHCRRWICDDIIIISDASMDLPRPEIPHANRTCMRGQRQGRRARCAHATHLSIGRRPGQVSNSPTTSSREVAVNVRRRAGRPASRCTCHVSVVLCGRSR